MIRKEINGQVNFAEDCELIEEIDGSITIKTPSIINIDSIIIFAFRYALPRETVAASIVAETLKQQWDNLTEWEQLQIHNDIKRHYEFEPENTNTETWDEILNLPLKDSP